MKSIYQLLLFLITGIVTTHAQTTLRTSDTVVVKLNGTVVLKIDGHLINSAVVENAATISLTGNITNTGLYQSTGIEEFTGTNNQTVTGVYGTSNLGNLYKNQIPNRNINLGSDLNTRTVDFGSNPGFIDADYSGSTFWVMDSAYNAVINGSNTRAVRATKNFNGYFKRSVNDVTTGNLYFFPIIADNGSYRGNQIQLTSLGTSGSWIIESVRLSSFATINYAYTGTCGTIRFSALQTDPVNLQSNTVICSYKVYLDRNGVPNGSKNLRTLLSLESLNDFQGRVDSNLVGAKDVNLCGNIDQPGILTESPGGEYNRLDGVDMTVGFEPDNPLPVELSVLIALPINNQFIRVIWQTRSELNCSGWTILRSTNAKDWDSIGWKTGNGTTSAMHDYVFDDFNVDPGIVYYYRLLEHDWDGKKTVSSIVKAELRTTQVPFTIYPNPTSGQFIIPSEQIKSVDLYDLLGRLVMTMRQQNIYNIETLANGVYIIRVTKANDEISTQRVVKD